MELDEKQYIAYELIAFTFLLGLVKDGNDSNTTFSLLYRKRWGGNHQKKLQTL
jgi:hypothetical protein